MFRKGNLLLVMLVLAHVYNALGDFGMKHKTGGYRDVSIDELGSLEKN